MLWPPADTLAKARPAVERALLLDDRSSDAHAVLAKTRYWFDWRWDDADDEFTRALELDPANVDVRSSYAGFLGLMIRTDEALAQVARAHTLELSAHASYSAGVIYVFGRRYEEAIGAFRRALDLEPDLARARWELIRTFQACSRHDEALTELRKLPERSALPPSHFGNLGHVLARAGQEDEARRLLAELTRRSESEYVASYWFAVLHAGLGEFDEAVDHLEDAYKERSSGLLFLQTTPWDPLRDHPRLQDLRRRVGLPDPPPGARAS